MPECSDGDSDLAPLIPRIGNLGNKVVFAGPAYRSPDASPIRHSRIIHLPFMLGSFMRGWSITSNNDTSEHRQLDTDSPYLLRYQYNPSLSSPWCCMFSALIHGYDVSLAVPVGALQHGILRLLIHFVARVLLLDGEETCNSTFWARNLCSHHADLAPSCPGTSCAREVHSTCTLVMQDLGKFGL